MPKAKEIIPFSRVRETARRKGWTGASDLVFLSPELVGTIISLSRWTGEVERGGVLFGYRKRTDDRRLYQMREFFEMENMAEDKRHAYRASEEEIMRAGKTFDRYNMAALIHTHSVEESPPSPRDFGALKVGQELLSTNFVVTTGDNRTLIAFSYGRFFLLLSDLLGKESVPISEWIPPFVYPRGVDLWRGNIKRYAHDYGYKYWRIQLVGVDLEPLGA